MSTSTRRPRRGGLARRWPRRALGRRPGGPAGDRRAAGRLVVNDSRAARHRPRTGPTRTPHGSGRSRRAATPVADGAGDAARRCCARRVIVKFKDDADATARPAAIRAVNGHALAPAVVGRLRPGGDSRRRRSGSASAADAGRPARRRIRAGALREPRDAPAERSVLLRCSGTSARSTWSGRGTSTRAPARDVIVAVLDSGVAYRDSARALPRSTRVPCWTRAARVYPALGLVDVPFAAAPDLGGTGRFVAPRDFIWDDDLPLDLDGHGTHVAGTIGQVTNNGVGVAGMAFNVQIMPVKVIAERVGLHLRQPQRRHRRHRGAGHPLRRRQRRPRDQHEHRPRRRRSGAGDRSRGALRGVDRGAFVAIAAGNDCDGRQPRRAAPPSSPPASTARWRSAPWAATSTAPSTRPPAPYVEIAAPGGDSAAVGGSRRRHPAADGRPGSASITYELGPALFRAPRFDVFRYYYLQGTSMATPHVVGLRRAAAPAGHHHRRRRSKRR